MKDLSAAAWNQRYLDGNTPWDLSTPTPEFVRLVEEKRLPHKGRALVPGGGRGYDAVLLARYGLEVDLVDFAWAALTEALNHAREEGVTVHAFCQDFFQLPTLPYHRGQYDLLLEYTFFCAIDPALRVKYIETAAALLKPGALFVGLFFPLAHPNPGPPFTVSRSEVEPLFAKKFEITIEEPKRSVKPRAGNEFLGVFRRK